MSPSISIRQLLAIALTLLLLACASSQPTSDDAQNASPPRPANAALYQDLGGAAGVERLVDALIKRYRADPRINGFFNSTDFAYFRERLIEDICVRAGGPCEYTGLSMEEAHSGMAIRESEFNYFVEESQLAMDDIGLPVAVQNRLLALLARERGSVIHQ
jgi:hemoglobin